MGRQNILFMLLTFPALSLLWLIGWSLYWIGSTKTPHYLIEKIPRDMEPAFTILFQNRKYATQHS